MKTKIIISLLLMVAVLAAFINPHRVKNASLQGIDHSYNPTYLKLIIPKGWPNPPTDIFKNNPLTEEGFQLGRKLFYDGRLSKDGNFACASCHQQFAAFSTYDHDFSHGFNNSFTTRNAPALFNLAWMKEMNWDGGVNHIELQALTPLTAPNEMAETLNNVLDKLKADSVYPKMFKAAFGTSTINSQRMLKAIAQFVGSIQSYNSKYDKVKRGEASFTISEQYGYNTFKEKCNACHKEPLFTDNSFRNNGLTMNSFLQDKGRMRITGSPADSLNFKVPSLRNLTLSFPYMHDGRFYALSQVIEHYRTGINVNDSKLDRLLVNRITMTNVEKTDLMAFLETLTDTVLVHDPRLEQPH